MSVFAVITLEVATSSPERLLGVGELYPDISNPVCQWPLASLNCSYIWLHASDLTLEYCTFAGFRVLHSKSLLIIEIARRRRDANSRRRPVPLGQ